MDGTNDEDNEFTLQQNEAPNLEVTHQRLKEFAYYLTENVERSLNFCLELLEERTTGKKPNSNPATALSMLSTAIPVVGRGVSSAIKEGEIFLLNKIDKKNSRTVADLVYYFSDHKDAMRQTLIEASINLFYCFELQFMKLSCDGGSKRAMQKLAKDSANRVFTHFLETKQNREVTKIEVMKGAVFGNSVKNTVGVERGKTLKDGDERVWKTTNIFTKTGIFFQENECYRNKDTKSDKYGFRRLYPWETLEHIRENWELVSEKEALNFQLKLEDFPVLLNEIREYIMTKTPSEDARLDREKKHQELMDDSEFKHKTTVEKLNEILEDLANYYGELLDHHRENGDVIRTIRDTQESEVEGRLEIDHKLTEIHKVVIETNQGQVQLHETTGQIQETVSVIQDKQEECAAAVVNLDQTVKQVVENPPTPKLSEIVADNYEVKRLNKCLKKAERDVRKVFKKRF